MMKTAELDTIRTFAKTIALPEIAVTEVLPVCELLLTEYPDKVARMKVLAEPTTDPDTADREINGYMKPIAAEKNLPLETVMLAVVLILGCNAGELYKRLGLSEKIYRDSMRDITIWTNACLRETGRAGVMDFFNFLWLMDLIRTRVIRLHRLEFEPVTYESSERWTHGELTVNCGDTVPLVHIPEDGPLLYEDVVESYRQAYRHFGMTGAAAFHCSTWLLYPALTDILPETSNIRKFAGDYEIVDVDHEKHCEDLWRIFGKRESYVPSELPRKTSLQRGLADYLASHDGVFGCGYGMLAFDGENVLK